MIGWNTVKRILRHNRGLRKTSRSAGRQRNARRLAFESLETRELLTTLFSWDPPIGDSGSWNSPANWRDAALEADEIRTRIPGLGDTAEFNQRPIGSRPNEVPSINGINIYPDGGFVLERESHIIAPELVIHHIDGAEAPGHFQATGANRIAGDVVNDGILTIGSGADTSDSIVLAASLRIDGNYSQKAEGVLEILDHSNYQEFREAVTPVTISGQTALDGVVRIGEGTLPQIPKGLEPYWKDLIPGTLPDSLKPGTHVIRLELQAETASPSVVQISNFEIGELVAPVSWQNPVDPLDVNNDGYVTPIDALLVINELDAPVLSDPSTAALPESRTASGDFLPFLDVTGDGFVTPLDALLVINQLDSSDGESQESEPASYASALANLTAPTREYFDLGDNSHSLAMFQLEARVTSLEPALKRAPDIKTREILYSKDDAPDATHRKRKVLERPIADHSEEKNDYWMSGDSEAWDIALLEVLEESLE